MIQLRNYIKKYCCVTLANMKIIKKINCICYINANSFYKIQIITFLKLRLLILLNTGILDITKYYYLL